METSVPSFILEQQDLIDPALHLFQLYLTQRTDYEQVNKAWQALFHVLPAAENERIWHCLSPLLDMAVEDKLPKHLEAAPLDHFLRAQTNDRVLKDSAPALPSNDVQALAKILNYPSKLSPCIPLS